jgi:protease I
LALRQIFERDGAQTTTVNATGQPGRGMYGSTIVPHASFYHVDSKNFDAIIFIGGPGSATYQQNRRAQQLCREFNTAGKPVAAIDIAPVILAAAHILQGKRATARPTEREIINQLGTYTGSPVEIDGNIITASSSAHVNQLASAVIRALTKP